MEADIYKEICRHEKEIAGSGERRGAAAALFHPNRGVID